MNRNLIAFLTVAFALPAAAQVVTLDSCRSMAVRNNKTIAIAEQNIKGAGYTRKAARGAYFPGIDFTGGYMYNQNQIELLGEDAKLPTMIFDPASQSYQYNLYSVGGVPVKDPSTGQVIPNEVAVIPKEAMSYDIHNVFAGAFTLTQPVFMGGQIKALNDIAKYAEGMARSARGTVVEEVIYGVDAAYWQVVSLKEKKRLAESLVGLVDSLKQNVGYMKREGVATESDVLKVEVTYNEAQIALTKVENGLTLSRMALAQLCGLPVNTVFELADEDEKFAPVAPVVTPDMQEVYARRHDLETLRQSVGLLKGQEKLALGAMLPKVAAIGMYAFSNPNVNHGFEKKFGGGFSVGATVTIPLIHWGGNYYKYRAAQSATTAQRLLIEDLEEKVDLQVSQAKFSFEEAYKTYEMTVSNMKSADANLHNAQVGFREGVLTADDVIAAQTAWVKANSERIDAEIGIRLCRTYLSKVMGTLGTEGARI